MPHADAPSFLVNKLFDVKPRAIRALWMLLVLAGCTYKDIPQPSQVPFDCSQSTLAFAPSDQVNASNCFAIDGSVTVSATGGATPYAYSLNGGAFQADPAFTGLGPGIYIINVKDANQCQKTLDIDITAPNTDLSAGVAVTKDTECLTDNGSLVVTASGGTPPYSYQFGTNTAGPQNSFSGLKAGYYSVTVRDNAGCIRIINAWVQRGDTGTSYANDIKPIIDTNCAIPGCHNGDNGESRNWTVFANVQNNAAHIKLRTGNKTMPLTGSLTQDQIDLIACWVDDGAKNN